MIDFERVTPSIGRIWIRRPEKRNALTRAMQSELTEAISGNSGVDVLIIAGEAPVFSAGADRSEGPHPGGSAVPALLRAPRGAGPIVIAQVGGGAVGLGFALALACDAIVAADNAYFSFPEVTAGIVPIVAAIDLPAAVGGRRAFEAMISGRRIDAVEALEWGLVRQVVGTEELGQATIAYAESLLAADPGVLRAAKRVFYATVSGRDAAIDAAFGVAQQTSPQSTGLNPGIK